VAAAIVCLTGQALFTNYLRVPRASYLFVTVGTVIILVLLEAFIKTPSRQLKLLEQFLYYAVTFIGLGIVLPLPSPYLVFITLLGLFTYFDFGMFGLNLGLSTLFVAFTARFLQMHGLHDATQFSLFLVSYVIIAVITYYAAAFLKLAEEELDQVERSTAGARANEKRIESLINNITDGVIAVDHLNQVMIYNAAALDVLDINIELKGKKLSDVFHPLDAEKQSVNVDELLEATTRPTINRDLRLKYTDGSIINLFLSIAPIYLGYGKSGSGGFTIILRDITREKSLEEERDEFISVVSHELRTPIAISEGNISNAELIVKQSGDTSKIKTALSEAHAQVLFLSDMINDLSTLSRAERGKLQVEAESVNVHELMNELADNYRPDASKKGLKLELDLDPKLELLSSSKLYVREILQNFITNAIKYTEKGSVTLGATATPKGVKFTITDTGIGISKSDQEQVFDKFFRSEDYRTRKASGTGLGLYVTMKLARLIHAEIDLESELNKGSTFTIFIPNFG
jgi:two-component system phosphate regulon sensor histidine kinase PhoR